MSCKSSRLRMKNQQICYLKRMWMAHWRTPSQIHPHSRPFSNQLLRRSTTSAIFLLKIYSSEFVSVTSDDECLFTTRYRRVHAFPNRCFQMIAPYRERAENIFIWPSHCRCFSSNLSLYCRFYYEKKRCFLVTSDERYFTNSYKNRYEWPLLNSLPECDVTTLIVLRFNFRKYSTNIIIILMYS